MGFFQRLGQKAKAVGRFGLKVGMVGGAIGLGYLGYKTGQQVKGGIDDTTFLAEQVNPSAITGAGITGARSELQSQLEQLDRNKNIAIDRATSNPQLPSLREMDTNRREQQQIAQASADEERSRRQAEKIRRMALKRRADLQMRTQGGGGQGDILTATKSANCVRKHGTNIKSRAYKRCMKK